MKNKFVRFSLFLILLVILGLLTLAFVEPNDVMVTRSITIRAAQAQVWQQVACFRNWPNWEILHERDSTVKMTYSGTDGQPGSTLHWAGDEHISGEGELKNEGADSNTLRYSFHVIKPGDMLADCTISVRDTAGLTKVTWIFHKHFPFMANAVLIVFNMDKYMGRDFDAGLANLKKYTERSASNKMQ